MPCLTPLASNRFYPSWQFQLTCSENISARCQSRRSTGAFIQYFCWKESHSAPSHLYFPRIRPIISSLDMASFAHDSSYQQAPSNETSFIPQYAEPPSSPRAPLPPGFYPTTDPGLQHTPVPQTQQTQLIPRSPHTNGDQNKNRLRKACDSCSIRKVKVSSLPTQPLSERKERLMFPVR